MKLNKYHKKVLNLTMIRYFSRAKRDSYIDDDILNIFEETLPKSEKAKLTGDINNPKSEVAEFDKDAQRLIRKFFRNLPQFIREQILEDSLQLKTELRGVKE